MHKHKEKLGYAFMASLIIISVIILTWTPGGPETSATSEHTKGLNPFEKMRAGQEARIRKDPISQYANEPETNDITTKQVEANSPKATHNEPKTPETCTQDQRLLGECNGTLASDSASSKKKEAPSQTILDKPKAATSRNGQNETKQASESHLDWLAENTSSNKDKRIEGVVRTLPERNIKAGCRFLGVIQDAIRVNSGFTNNITVNIRNPIGRCQLPVEALKLKGVVSMYNLETGFTGKIDTCTIPSSNLSSQPCQATVESIDGSDVLEGKIYDEEYYGIFFDALLATASAPFLAKIAETAATASTYWGAEAASISSSAISKAIERVTAKVNKKFEGREIRVPENALVIITFDADAVL